MGRVFQGASTVDAILRSDLIEQAAGAGHAQRVRRSRDDQSREPADARQAPEPARDYDEVIRRVHDLGIMINASFVFGLDDDGPDVFDRTVEWAVSRSIETATFHIMTPYPGTALHDRIVARGADHRPRLGPLRHASRRVPAAADGARGAARRLPARVSRLLRWGSIVRGALGQSSVHRSMRHLAYSGGWKKLEPLWDAIIRSRRVSAMLPLLEATLDAFGRARSGRGPSDLRHRRAGEDPDRVEEAGVGGAERVAYRRSGRRARGARPTAGWGPGTAAPSGSPPAAARRSAKVARTGSASGAIEACSSQRPSARPCSRRAQPTAATAPVDRRRRTRPHRAARRSARNRPIRSSRSRSPTSVPFRRHRPSAPRRRDHAARACPARPRGRAAATTAACPLRMYRRAPGRSRDRTSSAPWHRPATASSIARPRAALTARPGRRYRSVRNRRRGRRARSARRRRRPTHRARRRDAGAVA